MHPELELLEDMRLILSRAGVRALLSRARRAHVFMRAFAEETEGEEWQDGPEPHALNLTVISPDGREIVMVEQALQWCEFDRRDCHEEFFIRTGGRTAGVRRLLAEEEARFKPGEDFDPGDFYWGGYYFTRWEEAGALARVVTAALGLQQGTFLEDEAFRRKHLNY